MIANLFLGASLIGAEWVLYLLLLLSVLSIALILERAWFYHKASQGLEDFRTKIRVAASQAHWEEARRVTLERTTHPAVSARDLESAMARALLGDSSSLIKKPTLETLSELAQDALIRTKLEWDRNLAVLATIGSNAPFIGLFGTVLGIIKAFHDLSQQTATGSQTVTAGISEALVATAIGLLVAIPAVIAFNLFQRRVKEATAEAEALKSFLISKMIN